MASPVKRQYLLVDDKKYRRNSAPAYLLNDDTLKSQISLKEFWSRASVSDFSILLDNQSESGSSLEIDTSNLSRELNSSPQPGEKSCRGSYQSLPLINFEVYRRTEADDSVWNILCTWSIWKSVLLAQIMAGCLSVMDLSNQNIKKYPVVAFSNGQNFPLYLLLSISWTTRLAVRNDGRGIVEVLKLSGLRYILLSVLHVEANYLLLSSFQHDSYIGDQMIDCVAASLSLVLAYVCMEVQFQLTHVYGFVLGLIGAIGLCISNINYTKDGEDEEVRWGDILRIGSGLFLAFNSLAQELIVKSIDSVEYLGMIGFIGSIICGLQSILLEDNQHFPIAPAYWIYIMSFSFVQFLFNCLAPRILRDVGATGLHLALISSAFYNNFICAIAEKNELLYFSSYAMVMLGSYTFAIKRTSIGKHYFFPVKVIISKNG